MPLVSAGLLTGLLSLAGFPLTGGFASRWPIYRLVYQENHLHAIALVLSGGTAALGCWRGLLALLGPGTHPELEREPIPPLRYLPIAAVMLILTLLCLALGLFPQLFLPPVLKVVEGFTFLDFLR
jgi:formate hydrogenlyase subunit 3/multisubunit Na+/H+ antiporter MnhD subunit